MVFGIILFSLIGLAILLVGVVAASKGLTVQHIKKIYLYLVSLVSLIIIIVGTIMLLNMALKTWIFTKADNDYYSYQLCPAEVTNPDGTTVKGSGCDEEKEKLVRDNPMLSTYIKRVVGAQEYIHNIKRWCLWLVGIKPNEIRALSSISERLEGVRRMRLESSDPAPRKLADTPWLFREARNYDSFIIVPSSTSENRKYIPMGFGNRDLIPTNLLLIIPDGTLYIFGVLTSEMHMAWVRTVCGRLKSDFRYSKDIVYNNFPWPESPTDKQKGQIEQAAQGVLDARAQFPESSLADLYDPLTMPPILLKAHQELDKAVDLAYRPQPFPSEAKRMEFLFELYEKYTAGLFVEARNKRTEKQIRKLNTED